MTVQPPPESADPMPTRTLLGLALSWLVGCLLFVPVWAGLNFAFGTVLDGPIGAFAMEAPCQRLARTTEPLHHYKLSGGKSRVSSSVCHFASGPVRVGGPTDGLGFAGRELLYLAIGFLGYAACFAGAMALTVWLVRATRRLLGARPH